MHCHKNPRERLPWTYSFRTKSSRTFDRSPPKHNASEQQRGSDQTHDNAPLFACTSSMPRNINRLLEPTFPRWILVGRCCTLPMTNVQPLDRSIKVFRLRQALRAASAPRICCQHDPRRDLLLEFRQVTLCSGFHGLTPLPVQVDWLEAVQYAENLPEQVAWHRHFGHLEGHVLGVLCYFAPIFTSFSRSVVSDQCAPVSAKPNGAKLARL